MAPNYFRNIALTFTLFAVHSQCAHLNYSGSAVTTRFWDCCKPSCGWEGKAQFSKPVLACTADDKPTDFSAGTGCNGGTAYQCSDQQPWAINDTFAYGYAGAFLTQDLTHGGTEDAWCCACYQLDFTSEPLIGKSLVIQASNTAYDVKTTNRFSLAIPGGNTTTTNACAHQYGVNQNVFGEPMSGVSSKDDCENLPDNLQAGCRWRFDWFKDASYPSANFKRVVCPTALTNKTGCVRDDDKVLASILAGNVTAAATSLTATSSTMAACAAILLGLISI